MSAVIIDGIKIAQEIREEIKRDTNYLKENFGIVPGLVTILVGQIPASVSYVAGKNKIAHELGFHSVQENHPTSISKEQILELIDKYNKDKTVHGILVQLPLPDQIDEQEVICAIDPNKDVDGFHPINLGRLLIGNAAFYPCTPAGIQELIIRSGVETEGSELVVLGRSNIVGKPIANIMLQKARGANCTVTVCHTKTRDISAHTKRADILIVAAGSPNYIKGNQIKPGAVVIDVGVNRIGMTASGKAKLCGDVEFESAKEVASAITPVPGGVGPMTTIMLMKNTLKAAKLMI